MKHCSPSRNPSNRISPGFLIDRLLTAPLKNACVTHRQYLVPIHCTQNPHRDYYQAAECSDANRTAANIVVAAHALQHGRATTAHHAPTKPEQQRRSTVSWLNACQTTQQCAPAVMPTIQHIEPLAASRAGITRAVLLPRCVTKLHLARQQHFTGCI